MLSKNVFFLLGTLSLTYVGGILPVSGSIGECQTVVDCGGGPGVLILSLEFVVC